MRIKYNFIHNDTSEGCDMHTLLLPNIYQGFIRLPKLSDVIAIYKGVGQFDLAIYRHSRCSY